GRGGDRSPPGRVAGAPRVHGPNTLGVILMAIFGKDRERSDRGSVLPPTFGGSGTSSAGGAGAERERSVPTRPSEASGSGNNAFLGKGSRVVGKLTFEGPVRIEGHVEGEITAQDALTIGESA